MAPWRARLIGLLSVVPMVLAVTLTNAGHGIGAPDEQADTNATFFNNAAHPGADPFILHDEQSGYYYAYSTEGADQGYRFAIYRSPDLATWEQLPGGALKTSEGQWGRDWFWAPEVYHNSRTGMYFLFYSARMRIDDTAEHFRYADFEEPSKIGVAVAQSPTGPFRNIRDAPIDYFPYDPEYRDVNLIMDETQKKPPQSWEEGQTAPLGTYLPFIDPNVYFDDGRIYLYYSRNAYRNWVWDEDLNKYIEEANIYAVELTTEWWNDPNGNTMPTVDPRHVNSNKAPGDPPEVRKDGFLPILSYGADKQAWENAHVNDYEDSNGQYKNRRWEEGSSIIKRRRADGRPLYYLLYSANNFANEHYGVGYAVAENPLGPWRKSPSNPVLEQSEQEKMYSTGHGSPILSPDASELFYVHHGRPDINVNRRLYTSRMRLDPDTEGLTINQSTTDQPVPSGVAPYTMNVDTNMLDVDGSPTRIGWSVHTADGAGMDLSDELNQAALDVNPPGSVDIDKAPEHAIVHGVPSGVASLKLRYQRKSASGQFVTVHNIHGEQRSPVVATIPVTDCTSVITGEHEGDLQINAGVTCLRDATVHGNVRVSGGAALVAVNTDVQGGVNATKASSVWLSDSQVAAEVVVRESDHIVRLDRVTSAAMTITDNTGSAPVIAESTVDGPLSCSGNAEIPSNEGRPNTVHGTSTGQCEEM